MKKNLFLTGEKRVGKSTVIQKALEESGVRVSGFCTIKTNIVFEGKYSVHLLAIEEGETPNKENFLFFCGKEDLKDSSRRFNELGCKALKRTNCDVILMDELGPHEQMAREYQQKIFDVLNDKTPVLGVLQKANSPFLTKIATRPDVHTLHVNRDNCKRIKNIIKAWLFFMQQENI